jgi:hypothetical protein
VDHSRGDSPEPRAVQGPHMARVIELPGVGGLRTPNFLSTCGRQSLGAHRYLREAA